LLNLLRDARASKLAAVLAAVKLLGDQSLVPAQEGLGRRNRGDVFEALAPERVGQRGEATAFGIGEPEPAAIEVGFEGTVFLLEISLPDTF
jgi:hypothetical protein